MKKNIRNKFALLGTVFVLLSYKTFRPYQVRYELLEDEVAFATYRSGLIYIGSEDLCSQITLEDGDVFVLDQRNYLDPNMKICQSCDIHSLEERNEILEVLQIYEQENPTRWNRSIESMQLEWTMHNISYAFHHKMDSSVDVDLNNADEENYNNKVLQKIMR